MNDFLKSLRSNSKDKRYDRNDRQNRRQYGNGNYGNTSYNGNPGYQNPQYKNDRGNGNLKKPYKAAEDGRLAILIEEVLPDIKEIAARIASAGERVAAAEERKAHAMERLAAALQSGLNGNVPAVGDRNTGNLPDRIEKPLNSMPREDVLNIILSMREEGATYGKIADHLEDENIPTFSRKGKWHAQTIHRVCRECA